MEVFRHLGNKIEDYVANEDFDGAFEAADLILKQLNRRTDAVLFGYSGLRQRLEFNYKGDLLFVCDDEMSKVEDKIADIKRGAVQGHGLQAPFAFRCPYSPTTWCGLKRALERLRAAVIAICYGGPCDGEVHSVAGGGEQRIAPADESVQKILCGLIPVYNVVDKPICAIERYRVTDAHQKWHTDGVYAALFRGFWVPSELTIPESVFDSK